MKKFETRYVTFEQAKNLKEKGFDVPCYFFYDGSFEPHHTDVIHEKGFLCSNSDHYKFHYSVPEQWMVIEWLYEKYDIFISPALKRDGDKKKTFSCIIEFPGGESFHLTGHHVNKHDSISEAIDYVLNNLI
jgi:hypothetical protein